VVVATFVGEAFWDVAVWDLAFAGGFVVDWSGLFVEITRGAPFRQSCEMFGQVCLPQSALARSLLAGSAAGAEPLVSAIGGAGRLAIGGGGSLATAVDGAVAVLILAVSTLAGVPSSCTATYAPSRTPVVAAPLANRTGWFRRKLKGPGGGANGDANLLTKGIHASLLVLPPCADATMQRRPADGVPMELWRR
jgi:PPE-repeat protein